MRSFILTAAIAAALVTTSLTAGYAASSHAARSSSVRDSSITRQHGMLDDSIDTHHGDVLDEQGQADPVPPVTIHPQAMTAPMTSPRLRSTRLSTIESELGRASHRIEVDRRRGELTPREVRIVRREEGAIRATALKVAARHDGRIPNSSFTMLQGRVSDLNRRITHFANA